MKAIEQLIALGRQGAQGVSQIGAGLVQRALDGVYGAPQLAGILAARRRRAITMGRSPRPVQDPQHLPAAAPALAGPVPPPLAVAERVRTARLVGPHNILYGLMWLYLYPSQGIARRVLKITDRHLAKALKQQYFKFSDVPFDPVAGCKPLFDGMHAECAKVLNGRAGAVRVKQIHTRSPSHQPPTVNPGIRKAVAPAAPEDPRALALPAQAGAPAPAGAVHGEAYQGVVTAAGRTHRTGPDGVSYETYCLTLNDGGREIPLFGTELERQSADLGIVPGERVRIVFMGKVMTQVPGKNRPAFRNLYQLARVEPS